MKKLVRTRLLLAMLLLSLGACAPQPKMTVTDLAELLGIERWVVPMPRDPRYEWAFEIRDYVPPAATQIEKQEWRDQKRSAEVIFMPTGAGSVYRYWFKQGNGTSSGESRVDVCDNPDDTASKCESGQYEIKWYHPPKETADGKGYVLCDLQETFEPRRHKQVVLYITKYRLEDMKEDAK